ncbi:unnamed protein product [Psylliodes chrysocephalus]|uniref:Uncharacterized protein n=1 Tax=Psylliodes chrysocephalus TaxID=3402493 RepID=A0A9P0G925_9CUCU|nr:unnamed protein product [Psylliodes chrysocephala]
MLTMNIKQEQEERLDICEGVFKNKPDLITEQMYKDEDDDDVFDEFEGNTPGQNVEIKEESMECEEPKIEHRSDFLPKINSDSTSGKEVPFCATTIKKELEDTSEVKAIDIRDIKEEISEYIQSEVELLTTHCDLQTIKNEKTESLTELCDWEENERISNMLKNDEKITNIEKRRKQYHCQKNGVLQNDATSNYTSIKINRLCNVPLPPLNIQENLHTEYIESPSPIPINGIEFPLEDSYGYDSDEDPVCSPSSSSEDENLVKESNKESQELKDVKIEVGTTIENYENHNKEVTCKDLNDIKIEDGGTIENYENYNKEGRCKEQENNQSTKCITSLTKRKENETAKAKRARAKDFCYFCKDLVLNFARHIIKSHSYEDAVQKILSKPVGSKERKHLITNLRKQGNYLNSKVNFKPMKKSNVPYPQAGYVPCDFCLGLYAQKHLWRHKKTCVERVHMSTNQINQVKIKLNIDRELQEKVFPTMRCDQVSLVAKKDPLICAFGARYLKVHRASNSINVTSRKMRELSKLLIEVKKLEPSVQTLFHALNSKFYDHLVTATKIIARFDSNKEVFEVPTYATNISTSLRQCCDIAFVFALKKTDIYAEAESDLKTMIQLLETNWRNDVSTEALNNLNKITIVPLATDLKLLKEHLCNKAEEAACRLKNDLKDRHSYNVLLETVFCRVILLNRKKPSELQRLFLDTYVNSEKEIADNYEEFSDMLPTETILMKSFKRIVIKGKRDRGVPVLFSPDVEDHINILLSARDNFIEKTNRYFFVSANNSTKPFMGYKILSEYAHSCGAKNPKAIISTRLRKHLATLSQIFNMTESDLEQLATLMRHPPDTYRKSYNDLYQMAKITKILLSMEGRFATEFRGKSLDEIVVDMDSNLLDDNENNDEEIDSDIDTQPSTSQQAGTKKLSGRKNKKTIRGRWTEEQKSITKDFFKDHIKRKKSPKQRECAELISQYPDILSNKNWLKIKVFVQNIYTKKYK